MENLLIIQEKRTNSFIRIGDLSYFEGPLLSLFEDAITGHLYLFDWVDRDRTFNRWLIYRINPNVLLNFIKTKASHFDLFKSNPEGKFYISDIDNTSHKINEYTLLEIKEVPFTYYPNKESYFEIEDCKSFDSIQAVLIQSISRQKQENGDSNSNINFSKILKSPVTKFRRK